MQIGGVTIGRLYGGDWMFIPYDGGSGHRHFTLVLLI
jgi:hypothetical protein